MKRISCAVAFTLVAVAGVLSHAQAPRTRVVMLGTGTPNADPDRYGPAVAVVVDDASYLIDFGVGVVRRAAAAERSGINALGATKLTTAFATHLHSDHTLGLADLILTPWILERPTPRCRGARHRGTVLRGHTAPRSTPRPPAPGGCSSAR